MNQRIIIDVREPAEYAGGHVEEAINIPLASLQKDPAGLVGVPKDAELIVYCASGNRAGVAQSILEQRSYTNVTNGINQTQVRATYQL